jgi:hypothetical protein
MAIKVATHAIAFATTITISSIAGIANATPVHQGGPMVGNLGQGQGASHEVKVQPTPTVAPTAPKPQPVAAHPAPQPPAAGNGHQPAPAPKPMPAQAPIAPAPVQPIVVAPIVVAPTLNQQQLNQQQQLAQQQLNNSNEAKAQAAAKSDSDAKATNKNEIGIGNSLTGANVGPLSSTSESVTGPAISSSGGNSLINTYQAERHPVVAPHAASPAPQGQGSSYSYSSNFGMCSTNLAASAGLNSDQFSPGFQIFGFGARLDTANTRQQMEKSVRETHGQNVISIAADTASRFGNHRNSTAGVLAKLSMKSAAANADEKTAKSYTEFGEEMAHLDYSNDCTPVQPVPAPTPTPEWKGYEGWATPQPAVPAGGEN